MCSNLLYSKSGEPVVITQAGRDGENFGVLSLEFDKHGIIKTAQNSVYNTRNFSKHSGMSDFIDTQFGKPEIVGNITATSDSFKNTIVVLDNTYSNYASDTFKENEITNYKNLFITKSFSKDYALAGLRLGYVISAAENVKNFINGLNPAPVAFFIYKDT